MKLRMPTINFFRYLSIVVVSVVVTLLISDWRVSDTQVQGCERGQRIFRVLTDILDDASKATALQGDVKAARIYAERADRIRSNLVVDCKEAYPPALPLPVD